MGSGKALKRRQKSKKDLGRKDERRDPYDSVLIVCEGEKTEPNYLKELIRLYRISSANVKVDHECGTDPGSILRHAKKLYKQAQQDGVPYDRVYCVFDRDSHARFYETIADVLSFSTREREFIPCYSVPSFEFWYLLHFKFTTRPYEKTQGKSASDLVEKELKECFPDYKKSCKGMYSVLSDRLDYALDNAHSIFSKVELGDSDNPCTCVHVLVDDLRTIKGGEPSYSRRDLLKGR